MSCIPGIDKRLGHSISWRSDLLQSLWPDGFSGKRGERASVDASARSDYSSQRFGHKKPFWNSLLTRSYQLLHAGLCHSDKFVIFSLRFTHRTMLHLHGNKLDFRVYTWSQYFYNWNATAANLYYIALDGQLLGWCIFFVLCWGLFSWDFTPQNLIPPDEYHNDDWSNCFLWSRLHS